jgi:CRP/FNR family transcriptional regulator
MDETAAALASLFASLDERALLDEILRVGVSAALSPGDTVCHLGQQCSHLALVFTGSARVYQLAESGREITLYRVGPGECCILTASCIMSRQGFPAMAVCEQPLSALLLPAACVDEWMGRFVQWRRFVWTLMSNRLSNVLHLLEEVTFRRVDQRIMRHLLHLLEQQGATLALTHQTIADDVGTSREVVSRILKDLEQRQLLSLSRGSVRIDAPDGLRDALALCD